MSERPLARTATIILVVGIMAAAVWIVGERVRPRQTARAPAIPHELVLEQIRRDRQARVVPASWFPEPRAEAVVRDLALVYARRAYSGAPPTIPHDLVTAGIGAKACNTCHEQGGYVERLSAYAPVTPHPEYESCTQCHVPAATDELFTETTWVSTRPARIHRPALPGGPPPIPHTLQLRDNCISCHAGPAAPREVRTGHPERENCVQCHVPIETPSVFERPVFARLGEMPAGAGPLE